MGWSGGAMALGKLPVPGRSTSLDYSKARAYCACSGCGWGFVWTFVVSSIISLLSPSLWKTARYRLTYCLKGPLSLKTTKNLKDENNKKHRKWLKHTLAKPDTVTKYYALAEAVYCITKTVCEAARIWLEIFAWLNRLLEKVHNLTDTVLNSYFDQPEGIMSFFVS